MSCERKLYTNFGEEKKKTASLHICIQVKHFNENVGNSTAFRVSIVNNHPFNSFACQNRPGQGSLFLKPRFKMLYAVALILAVFVDYQRELLHKISQG